MSLPRLTLTARQAELLEEVADWTQIHGYPPSIRQLADARGLSTTTTFQHFKSLVRKGYLVEDEHEGNRAVRTYRIAGASYEVVLPDGLQTLIDDARRYGQAIPGPSPDYYATLEPEA